MVIDHIGIVVKNIKKGIENWEELFGYSQATKIVQNTRQKVKVVFLEKEGSTTIKLIEPTSEQSPAMNMIKSGGGIHHICFKCLDIQHEAERLTKNGCRVLASAQPGEAFDNENIVFIYAKNGLNIELIETSKKAARLL